MLPRWRRWLKTAAIALVLDGCAAPAAEVDQEDDGDGCAFECSIVGACEPTGIDCAPLADDCGELAAGVCSSSGECCRASASSCAEHCDCDVDNDTGTCR